MLMMRSFTPLGSRADAADLGDDSDDASDVSDSEPEQPLRSEDEEDLDAAEQTGGETVSAAAAADTSAGQRKKRKTFHNTTPEEVAARCTQGCSCSNKKCFTSLSQADLLAYRNLTEKIESRELQVYLAGKLDALARSSSVSHHPTAGERPPGERRRLTYEYAVSGARVCVAVFLFAHNCSRYLLHKIEAHLAAGCVGFTEHGGTGKAPWNVIPEEEMQAVVSFIEGYANRYGLPQPAAPRVHNKPAPTYLPCHTTKVLLHGEYLEAGGKLSYVSFIRVWKSKCTSVVIMKPQEDVCGTCSDLQSRILRARTEENRIDTTKLLHTHMTKAIDSCDFYRS